MKKYLIDMILKPAIITAVALLAVGCVDPNYNLLSDDTFASIPAASAQAEILESSSEGFRVPIVLTTSAAQSGTIQVMVSSREGSVHGTDFEVDPAPNEEGIVTLQVANNATSIDLTVTPILDSQFNPNKTVSFKLMESSGGVKLTGGEDFTLTIINQPIIEVSEMSLGFGVHDTGTMPLKAYAVTGFGLFDDIVVTGGGEFLVSLDGTEFSEEINISSGDAEQTPVVVIAQFDANTGVLGEKTGTLSHATAEGTTVVIPVSGEEAAFTDFAFSSFEEVDLTGLSLEYTKSGTVTLDNNPGEAPVDFVAVGTELGFDSSFDPDDIGDDGAEPVGVGAVTDLVEFDDAFDSTAFTYAEGSQGYHASDLDGTLEIVFDEITLPANANHVLFSVAMYLFIFDDNFDAGEGVELVWRTANGDVPLLDVEESNGTGNVSYNGGIPFAYNTWITLSATADISEAGATGRPVIRIANDNNDDVFVVDALSIRVAE